MLTMAGKFLPIFRATSTLELAEARGKTNTVSHMPFVPCCISLPHSMQDSTNTTEASPNGEYKMERNSRLL